MSFVRWYVGELWNRVPIIFVLLGLAAFGIGRRARRFEAGGGELFGPVVGVVLILIGVGIGLYQYRR